MRGSPLLRAALMVAALLALLIPLRSLTAVRLASPAMKPSIASADATVHLEIVSTATPFAFAVSHLGKVIWQGDSPTSPVAIDVRLPFPKEGIDLALEAKWPSGQTAAVKLAVAHDDSETAGQTLWGDGGVNDVLTFK
ncbi:MAG: hypothetical protein PHC88_00560 [Terrimicrobiaceae bacterium]|nr:hypothetical protein [Terrimicrobiaceae bacterium]